MLKFGHPDGACSDWLKLKSFNQPQPLMAWFKFVCYFSPFFTGNFFAKFFKDSSKIKLIFPLIKIYFRLHFWNQRLFLIILRPNMIGFCTVILLEIFKNPKILWKISWIFSKSASKIKEILFFYFKIWILSFLEKWIISSQIIKSWLFKIKNEKFRN